MGDLTARPGAVGWLGTLGVYIERDSGSFWLRLDEAARRYADGENMSTLSKEAGLSAPTLRKYLKDAGLLVSPEERDTALNRLARQLPHDEVIERYEGGESVHRIVASLKKSGVPATAGAVERILDLHAIIRHAKPGEVPRGAPRGISSSRPITVTPFTLIRVVTPSSKTRGRTVRPLTVDDLRSIAERYKKGRGESLFDLAREIDLTVPVLKQRLRDAGYEVLDQRVQRGRKRTKRAWSNTTAKTGRPLKRSNLDIADNGKPRFSIDGPLSEQNLKRLAERHKEGKGEPIKVLAEDVGVSKDVLRRALKDAGYVVSNRTEWTARELERLTRDIVRMYRDEEKDFGSILSFLRARDLHVSLERLRGLLRNEGVAFRVTPRPARRQPRPRPSRPQRKRTTVRVTARERHTQGRVNLPKRVKPKASDPRWDVIKDRLDELAERIVDNGEPIQRIARELEVDHNWLTRALKQSGHLPDMPLHRYRKWKRMQEQAEG